MTNRNKIISKKRSRGRPKGSRNIGNKRINIDIIILTCNKCKQKISINTTKPEIYTEEVRRNYICLNCK